MFRIKGLVLAAAMVLFAIMFPQDASALGECDCTMTPTSMTISKGMNLVFDAIVTNNTDNVGTVNFGGKITKPDTSTTGWVFGPTYVPLTAYGEQSKTITQDIPTSFPVGRYTYHGYVWASGSLLGQCEFDFIVPADVPKTRQTTCYDTDGLEIPCAGTGQDGELQAGLAWPNPRFTDNDDGTVTDNMTGLVWLKDANCFGVRDWATALTDCNTINNGECGLTDGSIEGDWRLPNINELESLRHRGFYDPAVPNTAGTGQWSVGDPFTGVQSSSYWSSSTDASDTSHAWIVYMKYGYVGSSPKAHDNYVWPVRGGQ